METMIKNFKTGFTLAILITCVQAYAIYTYGSAITRMVIRLAIRYCILSCFFLAGLCWVQS